MTEHRDIARDVSRRGFLVTIGAAGATFALTGAATAAETYAPTIWYAIDRSGNVVVHIIRAEMGQHVGTAIARIVAEELEADWSKVSFQHVDSDPKWGLMVTGGSWSVWQSYPLYSQAAAAGRMALVNAGAKLLGAAPGACTAKGGAVWAGSKSVSYGDIVAKGDLAGSWTPEELAKTPVKKAADRKLVGRSVANRDVPGKTDGAGIYGIDAKVPGMIYATAKLPPTRYGCEVTAMDETAAKAVPGYVRAVALKDPSGHVPGWVAVYAETQNAAFKAADALKVTWSSPPEASVSEADLQARARALIADKSKGGTAVDDPGVDAAFAVARSTHEATYTTATALHFQLEPVNALAFEKDGRFEIHTGNQWQSLVLPWLAQALERKEETIVLRTYLLGGGFGRRLDGDYAVGAALASKAIGGKPVKLVLRRPDDTRFDCPRSPSVQTVRMAFGEAGRVTAMEHHVCAGWPTEAMAPFFMPKGANGQPFDPFATNGANHWYNVGAHRVRSVGNDLANRTFRPGWLRSVGPGFTNWALESFLDEAAEKAGVDPLAFRLKMLDASGRNAGSAPNAVGGAKRQAAVLQQVATKAGWGKALPKNTGLGLATSFGQERDMPTWVACAARVRVDPASGAAKVEKLTLAADAGTIINPDGALAQMEGAALWGMSLALFESTEFRNGQVKDLNLGAYTPLRMGDVPDLDISFMPSAEAPVGLGEPATTVVGPAIGNAIYRAVGARVRDLPIRPAAVKAAMRA